MQDLDLIKYIAIPLSPVMKFVGLPVEMGLVWATALLNTLYGAIVVLLSLINDTGLTTAQVTVLGTMMLVAHAMPIELKIAKASGPRIGFQSLLRLGSAIILGWLIHIFYRLTGLLQDPVKIIIRPEDAPIAGREPVILWAAMTMKNLFLMFLIIFSLFLVMRILKKLRVLDLLNRLLHPMLKMLGIGTKASIIAIIGLTMGIGYGGGFIIHEARSGNIGKQDVFFSLSLMGLCHSLIEDTLLMFMIGGHLSGLLIARLLFALFVIAILVRISKKIPETVSDRFLWGEPGQEKN